MNSINFNNWFKNSKVVDEKGSALVAFHGSVKDFSIFDVSKINSSETDAVYNGFWFTSEKGNASPAWVNPNYIKSYYLSMQNPAPIEVAKQVYKDLTLLEVFPCDETNSIIDLVRLKLQEMGYDGVIHQDIPIVSKEIYEKTGKVTFKSNRGSKYTLLKNIANGGADLYDCNDECITGYYDFDDFMEMHSERIYVVFKPNQIKSTENIGAYDINNPDVNI